MVDDGAPVIGDRRRRRQGVGVAAGGVHRDPRRRARQGIAQEDVRNAVGVVGDQVGRIAVEHDIAAISRGRHTLGPGIGFDIAGADRDFAS